MVGHDGNPTPTKGLLLYSNTTMSRSHSLPTSQFASPTSLLPGNLLTTMRVLSLIALATLVSSFEATSASINLVKADVNSGVAFVGYGQVERSLRRHEDDDPVENDLNGEERGKTDLVDDALNKVDDVLGKSVLAKADDAVNTNMLSKVENVLNTNAADKVHDAAVVAAAATKNYPVGWAVKAEQRVEKKYPGGLTASTKEQLVNIELQNLDDIKNGIKMDKTGKSTSQRYIKPFPGMKISPLAASNVGRGAQRLTKDKERVLVMGVPMRQKPDGTPEFLFISPSKPEKSELIIPKGGWDRDLPKSLRNSKSDVTSESVKNVETVVNSQGKNGARFVDDSKRPKSKSELAAGETLEEGVLRELAEEAGVLGQISHFVGTMEVMKDGQKQIVHVFTVRVKDQLDQWTESIRKRAWVPKDDALLLASSRPENLAAMNAVTKVLERVKKGELPEMDPIRSQVTLRGVKNPEPKIVMRGADEVVDTV